MLTFLTRRQGWLSPNEIARDFRPAGKALDIRTVYRWIQFLRDKGAFVYYPYPRANAFGLQDVLVWARGVKDPGILGILPFASSFNVEVGLGDNRHFVTQGYWVPGDAMKSFREFWRVAKDLDLVEEATLFPCKNTHFLFSPFHHLITEDGAAALRGEVDNRYFADLVRRHLKGPFDVRVGKPIAKSPLVVPLVMEHIWGHVSSQHVWEAIREKGEAHIRTFAKGFLAKSLDRPGAALRLLYEQWTAVLQDFDKVFLQPRVFFDWTALKNSMFVGVFLKAKSPEAMVEAAKRVSERGIYTSLKPGLQQEHTCFLACFLPNDQLMGVLDIVREFHAGPHPPVVSVQDVAATERLFQPSYCRVDWRLFDPASLSWRFDGERYIEALKALHRRQENA